MKNMTLLYEIYAITRALFKYSPVKLQNNTQSKEDQTCTDRFYGYPDSALSALIATGLVRLVLLGSFIRCPLAVRVEGRVVSFLTLRTSCTAFGERADHRGITLMSPVLDVFHPLWTVLGCSTSKECNRYIARCTLDNTFANVSVSLRLPTYG